MAPYCVGSGPRVCTWPEHAKWAPEAGRVAPRLAVSLRAIYTFPMTISEAGLAGARGAAPAVVVQDIPVTPASLVPGLTRQRVPPIPRGCLTSGPRVERYFSCERGWSGKDQERSPAVMCSPTRPDPVVATARLAASAAAGMGERVQAVVAPICATTSLLIRRCAAIDRVDQCVLPPGWMPQRVAPSTRRFVPPGSHGSRPRPLTIVPNPAIPSSPNRFRQRLAAGSRGRSADSQRGDPTSRVIRRDQFGETQYKSITDWFTPLITRT